jgi:hypothetical protein
MISRAIPLAGSNKASADSSQELSTAKIIST